MAIEEYMVKIQEEYEKLGVDRIQEIKIKMTNALSECWIPDNKIPKEYLVHEEIMFYFLRCHEKAIDYFERLYKAGVNLNKIKLIQGQIWRFCDGHFTEEHSWIEINDNIIFDSVLQQFYTKNCYDKKRVKIRMASLSYNEVLCLKEKYGYVFYPYQEGFNNFMKEIRK